MGKIEYRAVYPNIQEVKNQGLKAAFECKIYSEIFGRQK